MPTITLPERDLVKRSNNLHNVFTPLRKGLARVAFGLAKDSPGGTARLVATDERTGLFRYGEQSFRTSVGALRCRYFELWRATSGTDLVLKCAYFTLLRVVTITQGYRELLCIHTDPEDTDILKQGPHLHVSCAPDPISHCHFPLEFGFLKEVLKDSGTLTEAMKRAIEVVAGDVLPRFKNR